MLALRSPVEAANASFSLVHWQHPWMGALVVAASYPIQVASSQGCCWPSEACTCAHV